MSDKKQQPAYPLRMPSELRADLEALAQHNKRSLNAEIVARLERSVEDLDELGVSDQMRLSNPGEWYSPNPPARGVSKERLIRNVETGETVSEAQLTAIISKALDGVLASWASPDVPPDNAKEEPNSGPKPRKRYTKK